MRRLLALLTLVLFLWPAAAHAAVALCAISGQVFNPDGTTLNNGTVQFNSQVTQVVGSTTIPPSIISTTTDGSGNMAPMSVAQGLFGTFTFCQGHSSSNVGGPGGGCAAPINGLIPINTTGNIQSVIAGTLLPSVGNATVNNLTATNNVNVGGQMQTQTLLVNGNSTLSGTLNVTGAVTTGAMTAPTLKLTYNDCSALTLAQAAITSTPPDFDLMLSAGAHCLPASGGWIADSNSAVLFGTYTRSTSTGDHNGGWQWLGNTGLTPGSTFTPGVLMALGDNYADSLGTATGGFLVTYALTLQSTGTALQLPGGSIVSLPGSGGNNGLAAGEHYDGTNWIADTTSSAIVATGYAVAGPGVYFYGNYGLTVGGAVSNGLMGYGFDASAASSGWWLTGSNPVAILQSNTNAHADILEVLPQNGTIGIGITYNGIHTIGSTGGSMQIDASPGQNLMLNTVNIGGPIDMTGSLYIQSNFHLNFANNGVPPGLTVCSAGSLLAQSTDNTGAVSFSGAGATQCGVAFGRAWNNPPVCVCSAATVPGTSTACSAIDSGTTGVTFYFSSAMSSSGYVDYVCMGMF